MDARFQFSRLLENRRRPLPRVLPHERIVFAVANESGYRDGSVKCLCWGPRAFP